MGTSRVGRARALMRFRSAARRPFGSLPSRIIVSVFAAALVTSVAVTWISTQSTQAFLRHEIDERFPEVLYSTRQRLELWYSQRQLDLETFGRSDTVIESLAGSRVRGEEARKYLAYVREGFPQYEALFVLDRVGRPRVRVGSPVEIADERIADLAQITEPTIGAIQGTPQMRFQIISTPIHDGGRAVGSLHAVVGLDSIEELLDNDDVEATARIYLIDPAGRVVARSDAAAEKERYDRPLPAPLAPPVVQDYTDANGDHVVGSAVNVPRFDWTVLVEESYDVAFAPVVSVIRKILAINTGIVLGFGLIAFVIARSIVRPIQALSHGARRIARGETDVEIPLSNSQDEIGVLSRALHRMVERLRRNQIELQQKQLEIERANSELTNANEELRRGNEVLEQLSFTDGLTRLHNHRYFQDRLRMEAKRSDRSGDPLALLLLDIDDFKSLNDRYGHAVGDEVLRRVAHVVNNTVRETDLPARYGGEEFAVLAPRTGPEGALALAEKLRAAVARARFRGEGLETDQVLSVTVSIGVSIYRGDPKDFFNEADRALYSAKGAGKDCVICAELPA